MKPVKALAALSLLLAVLACTVQAQEKIIVNLETVANPWADVRLGEKLNFCLSTSGGAGIFRMTDSVRTALDWNSHTPSFEELIKQAEAMGGKYLVDIFIDRFDVEKRKITIIPQAAFRYKVYGVITGKIRIIDVPRQRLVKSRDLKIELKATDRWRFGDDDIHDADLHLAAQQKALLFNELEDNAAREICREMHGLIRGNGDFARN